MKLVDVSHLVYGMQVRSDESSRYIAYSDKVLRIEFKKGTEAEVDDLLWPVYESAEVFRVVTPGGSLAVQLVEFQPLQGSVGELSLGRVVRFEVRE